MSRTKKLPPARYAIRSSVRVFHIYEDKDWAIHSAECYASFFETPVKVIDIKTGAHICTKYPPVLAAGKLNYDLGRNDEEGMNHEA